MPDIRAALAELMRATIADEADHSTWDYHEVRPMPVPPSWKPGQHVEGDCSKGCQYLARWAGAPDPMNNGFADWGNSSTIWLNAKHVDTAAELEVGDDVTFGFDGDQHAAKVLEAGSDPLLWSFGHQGAPNTYRLSQDGRPAQFCKQPITGWTPTPEDRLRARTGWFAWVAWRLGEGDWQHKPAADKSVRPNVPALVPLGWWRRYAKFLLRRKKGNPPTTKP